MTIQNLIKILEQAPNKNAQVFINRLPDNPETDIGYNFDDNNDIDLYIITNK